MNLEEGMKTHEELVEEMAKQMRLGGVDDEDDDDESDDEGDAKVGNDAPNEKEEEEEEDSKMLIPEQEFPEALEVIGPEEVFKPPSEPQ
jgi:hypothetical protein